MNKKFFSVLLSAMLILTSISGLTVFAEDVAPMAGSGTEVTLILSQMRLTLSQFQTR